MDQERQDHRIDPEAVALSRRQALTRLAGAALAISVVPVLAACSTGGSGRSLRANRSARNAYVMPDPEWPTPRRDLSLGARPSTPLSSNTPRTLPPSTAHITGVRARSGWSGGEPVPALMDRMTPIDRITLHHDGMTAFTSTSVAAAASRIEAIRAAHRGRGWGDIGYHYVLDPAGRVWAARPMEWQGAHVKDQNPGNVGICVLGNYERQRPTQTQLDALEDVIAKLMRAHRVPINRVHTHKELASTACPGRYLQPRLVSMRENNGALASV